MSDREVIARAIFAHIHGEVRVDYDEAPSVVRAHTDGLSDAVLSALGDRLLPDTGEFVINSVAAEGAYSPSGVQYVALIDRQLSEDDFDEREGEGPTIPAAIRAALEGSA